jgi:hypothetical protein
MFLMAFRQVMKKMRGRKWEVNDYLTMACMFCLLVRLAIVHVALVCSTNDLSGAYRHGHAFSMTEIYERETGSKLILVGRTFYNT